MTYKGVEVGIPTIDMFEQYVETEGFLFTAREVYDYCASNRWKTKKGTPMKTLESMVNVYNSLFLQNARKGNTCNKGILKRLKSDFDIFVASMSANEIAENHNAIVRVKALIEKHINK